MTPERLKCAVREAPQRSPLLDNDPVNTLPLKRVTTIGHPLLGNGCFFLGLPCRGVIKDNEGRLQSVEF
jgi:hypothetical protein